MSRNNAYLQSNTTVEGDEVYTPFYAVEPLLEFLPKEKITIWCPFLQTIYNCLCLMAE